VRRKIEEDGMIWGDDDRMMEGYLALILFYANACHEKGEEGWMIF
jgi:hypothetical protein